MNVYIRIFYINVITYQPFKFDLTFRDIKTSLNGFILRHIKSVASHFVDKIVHQFAYATVIYQSCECHMKMRICQCFSKVFYIYFGNTPCSWRFHIVCDLGRWMFMFVVHCLLPVIL